jgi:hypothetical protein
MQRMSLAGDSLFQVREVVKSVSAVKVQEIVLQFYRNIMSETFSSTAAAVGNWNDSVLSRFQSFRGN